MDLESAINVYTIQYNTIQYNAIHYNTIDKVVKGNRILFQFLFLMEKSILYAKITVSQFFFLQNSVLIVYRPFIFIVTIMS